MFFNFDSFSVVTGLVSIHDIIYIKYMASSPSILYIIICDQPQQTSRPVQSRPDQTRRRGQSDGWTWSVDWKGHLDYYIIILNRIALHSMLNCCVSASACADSTKPNPRRLWLTALSPYYTLFPHTPPPSLEDGGAVVVDLVRSIYLSCN